MSHHSVPFAERLAANTTRAENGCLIWTAGKFANGYGRTTTGAARTRTLKQHLVHRVAYELVHGPLEPGQVVDHDCHNRSTDCEGGWACKHRPCVEPTHLVARTRGDNLRHAPKAYGKRTHCKNGHEFTPENTHWRGNTRECRACNRERQAATKARRRAR